MTDALRWQTFVEIDVSICSLTYAAPPCMAVLGTAEEVAAGTATGTQRCFNTVGSCQDRANYAETFVTLRFAMDTGYQAESGIEAIASLTDADVTPGVISLGENLGQRPSVTCTFRDHPYSDTGAGFDKYLSTRTYDPFKQGTFWAKFAARHPNLRGKKLRWIQGELGQTLDQMETRHFIIDSFDGPALDGTFTITAKDPLKALDGERAVAPAISNGVLNADLTTTATTATLSPSGVGAEYPASGLLNLSGTELVSFTRSVDTLTIVRALNNTVAATHTAGDRVQLCLVYTAQDPANIIKDLEVTYGGLDASYIPIADWLAETAAYNGQVYSAVIPEPTSVKTLVGEVLQQMGGAQWFDEISNTLRLQVLRQISADAFVFDETVYLKGSLQVSAQPDKRLSQVWTRFAQRNPIKGLDLDNLPGGAAEEDTDSEADYGSSSIKTILSRWIPQGGRLIAENLNAIQLGRYLVPPRKFQFALPASAIRIPKPGEGGWLAWPTLQAADGSRTEMAFEVTSLKLKNGQYTVAGEELNYTNLRPDPLNQIITVDYNGYNLNFRDLHDNLYGAPIPKGRVTLQVASNARIGSTDASLPALDTGTWPTSAFTATRSTLSKTLTSIADTSGFVADQAVTGTGISSDTRVVSTTSTTVTLNNFPSSNGTGSLTLWTTILDLTLDGRISGRGGKGGAGKGGDNNTGGHGGDGGTGLLAQAPVDLSGSGKINGGGGGGAGAGGDKDGWFGTQNDGGGGGGGAGDLGGDGGAKGSSSAHVGQPGTLDAGGDGGKGTGGQNAGDGGSPGGNGHVASGVYKGSPGSAGNSVDGVSLVNDADFAGSYAGDQIN